MKNLISIISIVLILAASPAACAQGQPSTWKVVETSWVKYNMPSGWLISDLSSEIMGKAYNANNDEYGYWMSACYNSNMNEPQTSILATKLSYHNGHEVTLEDGKNHLLKHKPGVQNCMWFKTSDKEVKGLATVKDFSAAVIDGKIVSHEFFSNKTIFVRKVGNDVHILEVDFEDGFNPENQKSIIDAIYKSWQPKNR
ncbi:MAG: hypothetical protein K2K94_06715 [Muribaculaceae bacterium]|nr:hypothetical protein [Muribaculaceae bacterium]